MPVSTNIEENVEYILWAIDEATKSHSDYLITPEGSLSGYYAEYNQSSVSKALGEIVKYASSKNVGLILGTCFTEEDEHGKHKYDQQRWYSKSGDYLGFTAKHMLCTSMKYPGEGEMKDYIQGEPKVIHLPDVDVVAGGLICNDLWVNPCCGPRADPHLTHVLANMGAEIIFHSANPAPGGVEINLPYQTSNLQIRALADEIFIASVSPQYEKEQNCYSGVVGRDGEWKARLELGEKKVFTQVIEF